MVLILDKVIEDFEIKLNENDNSLIDQHMESHDSDKDDVEKTTHRMNLEAESLRNKTGVLHIDIFPITVLTNLSVLPPCLFGGVTSTPYFQSFWSIFDRVTSIENSEF